MENSTNKICGITLHQLEEMDSKEFKYTKVLTETRRRMFKTKSQPRAATEKDLLKIAVVEIEIEGR